MADSLEDQASGCLAQLLGYGLLIAGVGWVIQWVCRKIVDNAGTIIAVVAVIGVLAIVGVIINKRNEAKAAVARWEQNELVPLLASLNAMDKLNTAETSAANLPRELEAVENRIPALEQRLVEVESRARSLNASYS